jgi:molybdopterin adenylyltransferase
MRVCVLTASDRSARGERADLSGPVLNAIIEEQGWMLKEAVVLPDDQERLAAQLIAWCDSGEVDLILTTGGTGFAPRDRTPEATWPRRGDAFFQPKDDSACDALPGASWYPW